MILEEFNFSCLGPNGHLDDLREFEIEAYPSNLSFLVLNGEVLMEWPCGDEIQIYFYTAQHFS
jgi:hypothetical protein